MWAINNILVTLFDGVYAALGAVHPAVPLGVLSAFFGLVALLVIRYCSNQRAVAAVKDRIKAHLLAIKLYKDELPVMFRSLAGVMLSALKLQGLMLPPLLVMLIPMVLVCAQMAGRQEWRPLRPGERTTVLLTLKPDAADFLLDVQARAPEGVSLTDRVRTRANKEVAWNVQADRSGRYAVTFTVGGETVTKDVVVGDPLQRVSPKRHQGGLIDSVLYACEPPLASTSLVQSIELKLPELDSILYGSTWWVVWFLVLSIAVALIFKPIFGVKF
ncbi:MAG: hypothetical protein ACE5GE_05460 [Phycisphaerae bacterium]